MKITVFGGSPKGETSVTMQYVQYLKKRFPQHEFIILQAAQPIQKLEKNEEAFGEMIHHVRSSDGVLWAFPLYVFLVCAQYKRFIELIHERGAQDAFRGKYAASLSTSIHFFDHTAHHYIRAVSEDLGMRYAGSHSAGMQDLLKNEGQEKLILFAQSFFSSIERRLKIPRHYRPLNWTPLDYTPQYSERPRLSTDRKIVVVTDSVDGNIGKMIKKFVNRFKTAPELIDLGRLDMKGGCLGCLRCGYKNECVYTGKDEYIEMYKMKLKTADVLLFAGTVRDRYLSSRWKMFFDRAFFNTHQRSLEKKQFGFLISGPLSQAADLKEILSAFVEWQGSNLVDFVGDENTTSEQLDGEIEGLAERLTHCSELGYVSPVSFLGVGGMKIFRDDMRGGLKVVFRADHRTYRKTGVYDFPQKKIFSNLFSEILYILMSIPWMRKGMMRRMKEYMIMPYRRVLAD